VNEYSRLVFLSGASGAGDTERVATIKALVESDGGALEGQLQFRTNAGDGETTKMTILADGNVGIGNAAPISPLTISAPSLNPIGSLTSQAQYALVIQGSDTNTSGRGIAFGGDGDTDVGASIIAIDTASAAVGDLAFYTKGASDSTAERMRIDSSGNVGIGTDAPDGPLHVHASTCGTVTANTNFNDLVLETSAHTGITIFSGTGSDGGIYFGDSGGNNRGQLKYVHGSDAMTFATADSLAMTIDSSGNVGIGTAAPVYDFEVKMDTDKQLGITDGQSETGNCPTIVAVNTAHSALVDLGFRADDIIFATGSAERMRIIDAGVGIGTDTIPHGGVGYAKLAIEGTNSSSAGPHVQFTTASDDYPLLQIIPWTHDDVSLMFDSYYDGGYKSSDAGSSYRLLKNADKFQMQYDVANAGSTIIWNAGIVLDSSGNVGIGTTAPTTSLHVDQATASTKIAYFEHSNAEAYGVHVDFSADSPDDNVTPLMWMEDSTTDRLFIYSDGDVLNHDNSYGQLSDERIKQDIRDANSQWDDIKALKVRNFKRKDDVAQYGDKAWEQIGVVAQEVEEAGMDKLVEHSPPSDFELEHCGFGDYVEAVLYEAGDDELRQAVEAQDAVYETVVVQEAVEEVLWSEEDELPEGVEAGDVKTEAQEEETEEQLVSEAVEAVEAISIGDVKEEAKWVVKQDDDGKDMQVKSMKYSILHMKAVKALQEAMERIEGLESKVEALENA